MTDRRLTGRDGIIHKPLPGLGWDNSNVLAVLRPVFQPEHRAWNMLVVQDQEAWEREHDIRLAHRDRMDDYTGTGCDVHGINRCTICLPQNPTGGEHDIRLAQRDRMDDHDPYAMSLEEQRALWRRDNAPGNAAWRAEEATGGSRTEHPQAAPTTNERKDRSWPQTEQ